VVLAWALFADLAFVRPCPCPPPTSPHTHTHMGGVRSVIGEPLGCGDVHAGFTRDLVSGFTISIPPRALCSSEALSKLQPHTGRYVSGRFWRSDSGYRLLSNSSPNGYSRSPTTPSQHRDESNTRRYIRYTKYTFYKTWLSLSC
jgi:hypothetical protein